MRIIILALSIFVFSTFANANERSIVFDGTGAFFDGNQLNDLCKVNLQSCSAYIEGIADAIKARDEWLIEASKIKTGIMCIPKLVTGHQLVDIFFQYTSDHPEGRHYAASSIAINAFSIAFPCKYP